MLLPHRNCTRSLRRLHCETRAAPHQKASARAAQARDRATSSAATSSSAAAPSPTAAIRAALATVCTGLVERDTEARLMLLAALSGEHVLFLGPPGTAKSELARRLHTCLEGSAYFERLLTRFSVPEEIFGPLSMRALENDKYIRSTKGYLPQVRAVSPTSVIGSWHGLACRCQCARSRTTSTSAPQRATCPRCGPRLLTQQRWRLEHQICTTQDGRAEVAAIGHVFRQNCAILNALQTILRAQSHNAHTCRQRWRSSTRSSRRTVRF